ncbi:calcium-binding protein, partial [Methylobacterium sp. Leaf108]|uniref:calcium-binding protein n=1 Tax=Methylobacterium sp. Leaf108 TaxID=1736256 RepID=UPI00138ECAD9
AGYGGAFSVYNSNYAATFTGVERFDLALTTVADAVTTGDGDDIVRGNGGADDLFTGKGADTVDGGAGIDTWSADKSGMTAALVLDLRLVGLQGTYVVDGKTATVRDIETLGNGSADPFRSGAGNDVITTRASDDNDQIATNGGADTVRIAGGNDWIDLGGNAAGTVDTLILDWSAFDNGYGVGGGVAVGGSLVAGYGGAFSVYNSNYGATFAGVERFDLTLTARGDAIVTGDGNDTARGNAGNDILDTGKGIDVVDGGAGTSDRWRSDKSAMTAAQAMVLDLTRAGTQASYLGTGTVAGIEALDLTTGAGADRITTLAFDLNDTLATGDGSDWVTVAGGNDTIGMGAGVDTLVVDWSAFDNGYGVGGGVASGGSLAAGYGGAFNIYNSNYGAAFAGVEHFNLTLTRFARGGLRRGFQHLQLQLRRRLRGRRAL